MVKIRARKIYASAIIITCLTISLIANSLRVSSYEKESPVTLASASLMSPKNPETIGFIVITETPIPTPTAKPTLIPTRRPTAKPLPQSHLDEMLARHAENNGVDRELLKRIAHCESRYNAGAVNGIYGGLYQFSPSTWRSTRIAMNENPDPDLRYNAEEAIKTSAFKLAHGGRGAWPNCGR